MSRLPEREGGCESPSVLLTMLLTSTVATALSTDQLCFMALAA